MNRLKLEFSKFTIVGALNFVFTFILFYISVKIFQLNYLISLGLVSFFGMILTYSLNYNWVFKPEQKLVYKGRLLKYIFSGFISISLNIIALSCIVESTNFDPFYVQIALIPCIVIFNFLSTKFWSLKQDEIV